mgnify:CR=1 FL=1
MDFPKSKDDLKQDTEKYLRGLLEVGTIDYELYSYICDEFDSCINMAFELGKQEGVKKNEEVTQRQRKTEATGTSVPLVRFIQYSDN